MNQVTSISSTLLDLLERVPAEKVAIVLPEQHVRITYAELLRQVRAVAQQLAAANISRGDRVGIALPNGLPMIVSFLAAAAAGTAAPLNPAYREDEFRFYLEDTDARALILPPEGAEEARRAAGDRVPILAADLDSGGVVQLVAQPFKAAVAAGRPEGKSHETASTFSPPAADDVALVLHTSGSTGRPKRVPLTHANLSISAGNVARGYALGPDDVSMCVMPLFHVHGLVASTARHADVRWNRRRSREIQSAVVLACGPGSRRHVVFGGADAPSAAAGARRRPVVAQPAGTERLRFIRSCSASLPPRLMLALETAFGAPVLEAYGMTEARIRWRPTRCRRRTASRDRSGAASTCASASWTRRGATSRRRARRGRHQGPERHLRLREQPGGQRASFVDGWFRTGDRGYLDADGYLWLVARIKELINRGGEKISPREIDEVLLAHPSVAEAVRSACRTRPGERKWPPRSSCVTPSRKPSC
jgi:acyl-CoA synthetase (AMP-forming)/AMP-acid ligase II